MSRPDVAAVVKRKLQKRDIYKMDPGFNYAHIAGATCARELAYWRLHPERALPEQDDLAMLLKHGKWLEREAISQLQDAGFEVSETDRPFEDRRLKLKGRIDGKIRWGGEKHVFDVKGYAPASWNRLNTVDDFLESDQEYLRKVPGQMLSYVLLDDSGPGEALLYLINKITGIPKVVEFRLEGKVLDWGEAMLKKLELVNRHVQAGTLPDRIRYEGSVCGRCPFRADCLTDLPAGASPVVLDPENSKELLLLLAEYERLKPLTKEYEKVDEAISGIVNGIPKIILGDWQIAGIEIEQDRVDAKRIPAKTKARYSKTIKFWRKTITKMQAADALALDKPQVAG